MKPAINTQPRAQTSTAPGEIIVLPPLQVRKATPSARRWLNAALQRLLPPLLGWLCCCSAGSWRRLARKASRRR